MSPLITGCAFEVSGVLCVYIQIFSHSKATRPPPASFPACVPRLGLCYIEEALARVIALWGIAPACVCLSVYLSA